MDVERRARQGGASDRQTLIFVAAIQAAARGEDLCCFWRSLRRPSGLSSVQRPSERDEGGVPRSDEPSVQLVAPWLEKHKRPFSSVDPSVWEARRDCITSSCRAAPPPPAWAGTRPSRTSLTRRTAARQRKRHMCCHQRLHYRDRARDLGVPVTARAWTPTLTE